MMSPDRLGVIFASASRGAAHYTETAEAALRLARHARDLADHAARLGREEQQRIAALELQRQIEVARVAACWADAYAEHATGQLFSGESTPQEQHAAATAALVAQRAAHQAAEMMADAANHLRGDWRRPTGAPELDEATA